MEIKLIPLFYALCICILGINLLIFIVWVYFVPEFVLQWVAWKFEQPHSGAILLGWWTTILHLHTAVREVIRRRLAHPCLQIPPQSCVRYPIWWHRPGGPGCRLHTPTESFTRFCSMRVSVQCWKNPGLLTAHRRDYKVSWQRQFSSSPWPERTAGRSSCTFSTRPWTVFAVL